MQRNPSALTDREFDVVVVGGGICGAAILWDAVQRGLSAALIERGDFAGATSAHSLKVVHGGIRYLQHLDFARVRESCRERSALLRIAPHLVHPLPVVVPTFGHGLRGAEALGAAFLLLEAVTATRNRGLPDPDRRVPRARLLSRRSVVRWYPELERRELTGAGMFWDGQVYNPPRLVWEFIRTAARAGAQVTNYCEVADFIRRNGRVTGVAVHDRLTGDRFQVRAKIVVNAAGPYAEQLYVRCGLRPASGISLSRDMAFVIRRQLPGGRALALQTKYRDPDAILSRGPRHLFLAPWHDVTLVGVSSAVFRGDPDTLAVTAEEVAGFLSEIQEAAPHLDLTVDDIARVHAGLLPIAEGELIGGNVSFGKRSLVVDNAKADGLEGLITVVSNRLTTARGVAERAVDLAFGKLGTTPPRSRTEETPLYGGHFSSFAALVGEVGRSASDFIPGGIAERLAHNYGSAYRDVVALARACPPLADPIGTSGVLKAEVVHAIREEMAQGLADCVFRRTDLATAGHPGDDALGTAAELAAAELGWSADRKASELAEVRSTCSNVRSFGRG
jgi:glycerol-3-phosphate dehydrogenase